MEVDVRERLKEYGVYRLRSQSELTVENLSRINPQFVFFPHWSWLIPEQIYLQFECVIFHMTDLPYGRGGSPLQNLIVRGHRETMLSALRCVKELDGGPIYMKRPLSIVGTAEEILTRASTLIGDMIDVIVKERPTPVAQVGEVVEFKRRKPSDGDIVSLNELGDVYNYIRMLDADGYPPAFLQTAGLHLEFSQAKLGEDFVEAYVRIKKRVEK